MAATFTSAVLGRHPIGGGRFRSFGTYASAGGGTGGDIVTGNARFTESLTILPHAAAVGTNQAVVNETYNEPALPTTCTIVTDADQSGRWEAIGV